MNKTSTDARSNARSVFIEIPLDFGDEFANEDDATPEMLQELSAYALRLSKNGQIKDGDCLIYDPENCYRNSGKYLWDAQTQTVVLFASDLDEYGCIPRNFDLRRFPAQYFEGVLDHNSYVRLDKSFIDQIVSHAKFGPVDGVSDPIVASFFMFGKTRYNVLGVPEDCDFRMSEISEERSYGEYVIPHDPHGPERIEGQERALNFMRLFIIQVLGQCIDFDDWEGVCPEWWSKETTLYVRC